MKAALIAEAAAPEICCQKLLAKDSMDATSAVIRLTKDTIREGEETVPTSLLLSESWSEDSEGMLPTCHVRIVHNKAAVINAKPMLINLSDYESAAALSV